MQPTFNLFTVLNLLGAAQALLLALALVSIKRGRRIANLLLAAFSATVSILIAWTVLISNGYGYFFPHLFRINHPFDFAAAPLLYLYVRALVSKEPKLKKRDLLHFIPFGLCLLYLLPYYFQSGEDKLRINNSILDVQWYQIRTSLVIPQALLYLALAGFLIARFLRENKKSAAESAVLFQVKFFLSSWIALWVVAVLRYLFDVRYPTHMRFTNLILPFGATIIIYVMAYLGLRRPETLIGVDALSAAGEPGSVPAKKYEKSTLTEERAEFYLKKLLAVMETDKPYMDNELTLPKLAAKLLIPTHHLSQIINERLNQNFFDFVNAHRIEEAKRQLMNPAKKHYSLLAIAEEVGFNSKSAFNSAFKKQTSVTPSEYRKLNNSNGHS
jgi:AraC-like DNA-binding protein